MADEQKWQLDQRTLFILNSEGVNKFDMTVQPGQDDQGARVKHPACEEMAESILLALNAHAGLVEQRDELLRILATLVDAVAGEQEDPGELERELGKPAVYALEAARAVLAALATARGE